MKQHLNRMNHNFHVEGSYKLEK